MDVSSKRSAEDQDGKTQFKRPKVECSFNEKCYRKNPHHFMEYDHPFLETLIALNTDDMDLPDSHPIEKSVVLEQLNTIRMIRKLPKPSSSMPSVSQTVKQPIANEVAGTSQTCSEKGFILKLNASPYNVFYTTLKNSDRTLHQNYSLNFRDLLCPSLGDLEKSLQINFMVDIQWVMEQYKAMNVGNCPMTLLYGYDFPKMKEYMLNHYKNITPHLVKMNIPFGCHHSKCMVLAYKDGSVRFVISTANLYMEDWTIYCQGMWISDKCPPLKSAKADTEGVGPTAFKTHFLNYLKSYNLDILNPWLEIVKNVDCSSIRVFLVPTIPGHHPFLSSGSHLTRMKDLLGRHCSLPQKTASEGSEGPESWPVVAQASSLGSLGPDPSRWFHGVLLDSLKQFKTKGGGGPATLMLIFPSKSNVLNGYFGADGSGCLINPPENNSRQPWLKKHLFQWKANYTGRSRGMPHIKTYSRISPCATKMAWHLLTSANVSKVAWGTRSKTDVYTRSYELGVLFLPSFFDQEYFDIDPEGLSKPVFNLIYDLPLVAYKQDDEPWSA